MVSTPAGVAHRLPAELWADIFGLCAAEEDVTLTDDADPNLEVQRVTKQYLLWPAAVCSYWREIVTGTPALWSTIVADTVLWRDARCTRSAHSLLEAVSRSLKRSAEHLITLQIAIEDDPESGIRTGEQLLALLCPHSARWKSVYLYHQYPDSSLLVGIKNKIPMLDTLKLSLQNNDWRELSGEDIFALAPQLKYFTFTGFASRLPTIPVSQLESFTFTNLYADDFADAMILIGRMDTFGGRSCLLNLDALDANFDFERIPPITSHTTSLHLDISPVSQGQSTAIWDRAILGALLGKLTLPSLQYLGLVNGTTVRSMSWAHLDFLDLVGRSRFQTTLAQLELNRVLIKDYELLECLDLMPALKELIIADCGPEHQAVATDVFFSALRNTSLVPKLDFLSISSLLAFSDSIFTDFLQNRAGVDPVQAGSVHPASTFEIKLYWIPTCVRQALSATVLSVVKGMEEQGRLLWTMARDPEYADVQSGWARGDAN